MSSWRNWIFYMVALFWVVPAVIYYIGINSERSKREGLEVEITTYYSTEQVVHILENLPVNINGKWYPDSLLAVPPKDSNWVTLEIDRLYTDSVIKAETKPVEDYMWIVLDTASLINRIKQQVLDSIDSSEVTDTTTHSTIMGAMADTTYADIGLNSLDFDPEVHTIVAIDTFGFTHTGDTLWEPILDTLFRWK